MLMMPPMAWKVGATWQPLATRPADPVTNQPAGDPACCCPPACQNCIGNEIQTAHIDLNVPQATVGVCAADPRCTGTGTVNIPWPTTGECRCADLISRPPMVCPAAGGSDYDRWDVCVNEIGQGGQTHLTARYRRFDDANPNTAVADYYFALGTCNGPNNFTPDNLNDQPIDCTQTYTLQIWQNIVEMPPPFCNWTPNLGYCVADIVTIDLSFTTIP